MCGFFILDNVILETLYKPFCKSTPTFFMSATHCQSWVYYTKPSFIFDRLSCALSGGNWNDEGFYGALCYPKLIAPLSFLPGNAITIDPNVIAYTKLKNVLIDFIDIRYSPYFIIPIFTCGLVLYLLVLFRIAHIKVPQKPLWLVIVFLTFPFGALYYYFTYIRGRKNK